MIVSASRRTDIPDYFPGWFMDRVREGFCSVPNPFNPRQVSRVSLLPEDVDVIAFWTKNPGPMVQDRDYLDQLKRMYRFYFQFTLNGYPSFLEPWIPEVDDAVRTFTELSRQIGSHRVIWRYDPIVWSNVTDLEYHTRQFSYLAKTLEGWTSRVVVSLLDDYPSSRKRLLELSAQGVKVVPCSPEIPEVQEFLLRAVELASSHGLEILSCAEGDGLADLGIRPGKCIDDEYIRRVFGLEVSGRKDPNQRLACGCVVSKDIGAYGTCPSGCLYCYANRGLHGSAT